MSAGFIKLYKITVTAPPSKGSSVRTVITDSQITGMFHVNSTGTNASPDAHGLVLYNPSPKDLVALREKGAKVHVQAGYRYEGGVTLDYGDLPTVFKGEITKSNVTRTNTDTVLKIKLSQGFTEFSGASVAETFPSGSYLSAILANFCYTTDLDNVIELGTRMGETIPTSQTYNGPTMEVLEKFCKQNRLKWYLEDETIYVVSLDEKFAAKKDEAIFDKISHRIKGVVNWTVDDAADANGATSVQVDLNLFLYPWLGVGSTILLTLEDSEVTLVVESVKHMLDFYGDVWDTKIIAKTKEAVKIDTSINTDPAQDFSNVA